MNKMMKISFNKRIADSPANLKLVQEYINTYLGTYPRIYPGNFSGFKMSELLMILGFTVSSSILNEENFRAGGKLELAYVIDHVRCYAEQEKSLIELVDHLEEA